MRKSLIFIALLAFIGSAQGRDLKAEMSPEAFRAAGLEKLSDAELAALNRYLSGGAPAAAMSAPSASPSPSPEPAPAAADRRGLREDQADRSAITARLVGEFRGWGGSTRFTLDNGQIWVQTNAGESYSARPVEAPGVTIKPGFMGTWMLKVDGYNATARVRRIQ
jgi:hypothetical protein